LPRKVRYQAPDFASEDPAIAHFAQYLTQKGQSPRTIVAYQRDLEHFGSYLAAGPGEDRAAHRPPPYERLVSASAGEIVAYVRWLQGSRQYAHRSIRRKVSCLRSFYRMLRFERARDDNPALDVPTPKLAKRDLPGVLAISEVAKVLALQPPAGLGATQIARDRAILECLYSSGLRRSELVGLNESDVNLASRTLRVVGKGNKTRHVPMTRQAAGAMERYLGLRGPSPTGAFFTGRGGARISESAVYKIVRLYLRLAGVAEENAHPHVLRHSVATHMRERGADVLFLKDFLGHASTATTEISTHLSAELLREEFEQTHARAAMDAVPAPAARPPRKRPRSV
jgi:site-specific recombinase XerD